MSATSGASIVSVDKFEDTKGLQNVNGKVDITMAKQERKMTIKTIHMKQKTGIEFRCSGRVSSSCTTSGIRHATNLVTNSLSTWSSCNTNIQ
jgi:hypothetical protein